MCERYPVGPFGFVGNVNGPLFLPGSGVGPLMRPGSLICPLILPGSLTGPLLRRATIGDSEKGVGTSAMSTLSSAGAEGIAPPGR